VRDILYAVGIAPAKLPRVVALCRQGVELAVVLDSLEQARAVAAASAQSGTNIPVLIEIDSDGHRSGVRPGDPLLIQIGTELTAGGAVLRGVMTHAGESYERTGEQQLIAAAENERATAVACAQELRRAGLSCPVVSVGSTPTAHFARDLSGVTEVRAGVFVFFDLVMAGIGVCSIDDIALSVLATVIGHQKEKGLILIDAGWMALSRDRGTARQAVDQGYGVVCDVHGRPCQDLLLTGANQEHGIISVRPGSNATLPDLRIGSLLRVLPNHACSTAAQHAGYHLVRNEQLLGRWDRFPSGW
jgi:D-serine deaminase-like pyridoxal phosphate-dependent protein